MFSGPLPFVLGTIFAIVSFLFVDLFDSLGVFLGIAPKAGLVDEDGKTPGAGKALFVSAGAAAVGAVLEPVRSRFTAQKVPQGSPLAGGPA